MNVPYYIWFDNCSWFQVIYYPVMSNKNVLARYRKDTGFTGSAKIERY